MKIKKRSYLALGFFAAVGAATSAAASNLPPIRPMTTVNDTTSVRPGTAVLMHASYKWRIIKGLGVAVVIECLSDPKACAESVRHNIRSLLGLSEGGCIPADIFTMLRSMVEYGSYSTEEKKSLLGELESLRWSKTCSPPAEGFPETPPPSAFIAQPKSLAVCRTNNRRLGSDALLVRVGPNRQLPILTRLAPPTKNIDVLEVGAGGSGGWVKIRLPDGVVGWVKGVYLICE